MDEATRQGTAAAPIGGSSRGSAASRATSTSPTSTSTPSRSRRGTSGSGRDTAWNGSRTFRPPARWRGSMDAEAYEGLDARLDAVEALLAGVLVALFDGRVLPARAIIAKLEDAEEHLRQR